MTSFVNFAKANLLKSQSTLDVLSGASISDQKRISYNFTIDINFDDLSKQASIFSDNYAIVGYIDFSKLFGTRDVELIKYKLYQAYIYDRCKSIFNGLNYNFITKGDSLGVGFAGHCALFNLLRSPNFNLIISDDLQVQCNFDIYSSQYYKTLTLNFVKAFKFLKPAFDELSRSRNSCSVPFYISEFEETLNKLRNNFYIIQHLNQGVDLSDGSSNEEDKKDNKRNNKNLPIDYSSGKLCIKKYGDDSYSDIVGYENNPVFNSFCIERSNVLMYHPLNNGKSAQYNPSFSFSKSVFIKLKSDYDDFETVSKHYKSYPLTGDENWLLRYEVYAITGIKCKNSTSSSNTKRSIPFNFKPISSDVDLDFLLDKTGKTISDLLEMIYDKGFDDIDIVEFLEDLLSEGK